MSHSHLPLAEHIGIKLKYLEPWAEFPGHCRMPFKAYAARREEWALSTDYVYPGPIQYFGPSSVCDEPTKTLQLNNKNNHAVDRKSVV